MAYRKAWEVAYRRDRAGGKSRYVDAEPTRARLAELAAAKVPLRAMSRACGLSGSGVKAILAGRREHVQQSSADRVERLSLRRIYAEQTTGHVPRIGAARRVQALLAIGWSHRDLAAAGVPNTPNLLATGGHLVTVKRWREVRDLYDRLSMTPGPSPRTRGWAKSVGYAPPLAWDDACIDDPSAHPQGEASKGAGAHVIDMVAVRRTIDSLDGPPLTSGERREVARAMAATGASDRVIGHRLGVADRTVLRWRRRHQIPAGHAHPTSAGHRLAVD